MVQLAPMGSSPRMTGRGQRRSLSVRLRARELDHLRPLVRFLRDARCVLRGREGEHHAAEVGKARLYPGLADKVVDLVQALKMEREVIVSSFDHEQLAQVRKRSKVIPTGVLFTDRMFARSFMSDEEYRRRYVGMPIAVLKDELGLS